MGSTQAGAEPMRLASWNVESIRAHLEQVTDWIDVNSPDLVCMQETKAGTRKFPVRPFVERGFDVVVHGGDDGRGGVAIVSRLPLDDVTLGFSGSVAPLDEPRSISATAAGIRLHTVYAPNGRKVGTRAHAVKLAWLSLLTSWLKIDRAAAGDQILIGDLNIAPLDLDVWNAERYRSRNLTSPAERAAFVGLLDDGELVDVIRDRFGDDSVYTWWNRRSDFYESDRGWRLDHFLATPPIAARVKSVSIDRAERGRNGSTDHAPLLVTLAADPTETDP